jgi:hypothetical protein
VPDQPDATPPPPDPAATDDREHLASLLVATSDWVTRAAGGPAVVTLGMVWPDGQLMAVVVPRPDIDLATGDFARAQMKLSQVQVEQFAKLARTDHPPAPPPAPE